MIRLYLIKRQRQYVEFAGDFFPAFRVVSYYLSEYHPWHIALLGTVLGLFSPSFWV